MKNTFTYVFKTFIFLFLIFQGTIGVEMCEQIPNLDAVLVMTSGGGLIAGIATAIKGIKPSVKGKNKHFLPPYIISSELGGH